MITILCGENNLAVNRKAQEITRQFVSEYGDLALEKLEGEDTNFDSLSGALTTLPFLVDKKLVEVKRLSENKDLSEKIEQILSLPDETTDLLIVEGKLDKRSVYYKTLKKQAGFTEFSLLSGAPLINWVVAEATEQSATISRPDAQYLVDRTGQNQYALSGEINKLANYASEITKTSIDLLTEQSSESNIFDLLSAAFNGQHKRALDLYEEQRQAKVEPYQILSMIVWQLHQIALAKTSGSASAGELASRAGLSPYSAGKALQLAESRTLRQIRDLAVAVADLEYQSKTSSVDIDEALRIFILEL